MRITGITIKNVLGVEDFRIEPGQLTKISGQNGSGKSSILAGILAAINRGNLANLKRVGSDEEPEVVLVLDNGQRRVECNGDETVVKQRVGETAAYEKVRQPKTWLSGLFDATLANPLTFLQARPQDRTDILLETLPLQLDREALHGSIANAWPEDKPFPDGHPLQVLSEVRTVLFDERTGVNRSQRDKASYAYEANKALPAELPEDPAAELAKAAEARDTVYRRLADKKAAAETAEAQAVAAARAVYEQEQTRVEGEFKTAAAKLRLACAEKVAELERQIALVKAETEAAVAAEKAKGATALEVADQVLDQAEAAAAEARQKALDEVEAMRPELDEAQRRVTELTALSKNVAQLQEQKRLADRIQKEADDLKEVSDQLTKALESVEVYKAQLLAGLPIPGLEIRGKEIFVNGIAFDALNTAERYRIAVKVAVLRAQAQTLKVLFIDGAEALDAEHFKILEEELVASGVQAFVARVDDGPLTVEAHKGQPEKVVKMPPPAPTSGKRRPVLQE